MWKREGTARRFAWAGTGARHPFPGRRGKEGQKGTAALRAAPPFQNPAESRLRRAQREASPRRPCKSPQKAASDEPIGKHRRGDRARYRWQDGWVKKEVRPGGRKMWKREGTARRFAWAGTGARHPFPGWRGREGQKGTAALRAVPPLENPVGSRLGRAQREAPPRRPCKTPQKAASDEPFGEHRLGDRARYRWPGGRVKEEA